MSESYAFNTTYDMTPAFPGMIADAGFTDTVTVPCGATAQPFGTVVARVSATGISVIPHSTNPVVGIALHDHTLSGRVVSQDGYVQYDAMSVMSRGRVWARASGACTKDAVAKYDPATGLFATAAANTMPQAKFLTANITMPGIMPGDSSFICVLVELHAPTVA